MIETELCSHRFVLDVEQTYLAPVNSREPIHYCVSRYKNFDNYASRHRKTKKKKKKHHIFCTIVVINHFFFFFFFGVTRCKNIADILDLIRSLWKISSMHDPAIEISKFVLRFIAGQVFRKRNFFFYIISRNKRIILCIILLILIYCKIVRGISLQMK